MHILCLTARLPFPPNRGDRLRAYHFIRELSRHHQITLLSFIEDETETANLAGLRPFCWDIQLVHRSRSQSISGAATGAWKREPLQTLYYRSSAMSAAVDQLLARERIDMVYVHLFRMAQYVVNHPEIYRVVDLTDAISTEIARSLPYRDAFWRAVYSREQARIARYETAVPSMVEEAWLISETDRQALIDIGARGNLQVVANGVDIETYHPLERSPHEPRMIFVGHMGVPHNIDAAEYLVRELLPRVQQAVPAARLDLVGSEPHERVLQLGAHPGVSVLGHVPDLNAALNRAAVFVAPLRFAAGIQNKVLEAMAAGLPVVTTSLVNRGLNAVDGQALVVADTADQQVAAIVALLNNPGSREQMGAAAHQWVRRHFRWDRVSERVAEIERLVVAHGHR